MAYRHGAPAGAIKKAPTAAEAAQALATANATRLNEANALLSSLGDGGKFEGTLRVVVIGARDLEAKDEGGVSDPFCTVSLLGLGSKEIESKKGKPMPKTIKPVWNDTYVFVLRASDAVTHILFEVRDDDGSTSQFLGEAYYCLGALRTAPGNKMTSWLPLLPRPDKPHKGGSGDVHVMLEWQEGVLPAEKSLLDKMTGLMQQTSAADETQLNVVRQRAAVDASTFGVPPEAGATLRVTVHEARNLLPLDGSTSADPFVSVDLLSPAWASSLRKKTRTSHDTLDPVFEEIFTLPLTDLTSHVRFDVRDQDGAKSSSIGCVVLPVGKLIRGQLASEVPRAATDPPATAKDATRVALRWFPLEPRAEKVKAKFVQGDLCISLEYFAPGEPVPHVPEGRVHAAELYVTVLEARGLASKDANPAVTVSALELSGKKLSTKATPTSKADKSGAVSWNREINVDLHGKFERVHVEMRDHNPLHKSFLGELWIERQDLELKPLLTDWFPLRARDTDKAGKVSGELRLCVNYVQLDKPISPEQFALVPPEGIFSLKIIGARNLVAKQIDGTSDPFCVARIIDVNDKLVLDYESETEKGTVNPRWTNQKFYFRLAETDARLECELRDAHELGKSHFLGYFALPLKQLNTEAQAEKWVKLGKRPNEADDVAQGELLLRWNFTRTRPIKTQAQVDAETLAKRLAEIAAVPTARMNRIAAQREWDSLSLHDCLRLVMRLHPHTAQGVTDALLLRDPKLTVAASLALLVTCCVIDFFDFPASSWLWLIAGVSAFVWLLFDLVVYDPDAWAKLSEKRAQLAKETAAAAAATKAAADKAAAEKTTAAAAATAAAAPSTTVDAAAAASSSTSVAAPAAAAAPVLPPIPPSRVTYAEVLAKPHASDQGAQLILASVEFLLSCVREVLLAAVKPSLHLRAAVGVCVGAIVCGFLSEVAPSCIVAFLMLEAILLLPWYVERNVKLQSSIEKKAT
jgi:hypothetical protein